MMAPDLAGFLAIIAVGIAGDPLTQRWSIGSAFTPAVPLFPARGILGTHNKYEGDASIMRVSLLSRADHSVTESLTST